MSDIAIRAENLGKMYRIGARRAPYGRFSETLMCALAAPIRRLRDLGKPVPAEELIWALQDVSFEVKRGEAVGIIGRNGAGKSTLLKVLSRITEPTTGRVELHGRVGSLLEVGTGFHPELTGRENIYLNGTILGMKRAEIQSRFDEIVAFAEIERFLDTPVKHYSSGMYVRLAFAVAAHLEPEILLVDEVLAVGDVAFQKRCLGKMEDVAYQGRTVLFVSHNMSAVLGLCKTGLLLEGGTLVVDSDVSQTVSYYLSCTKLEGEYCSSSNRPQRLTIDRISVPKDERISTSFSNSETLLLHIECSVHERIRGAQIAFEVWTARDECLFSSTSQDSDGKKTELEPGRYVFGCPVNLRVFREGRYSIRVSSSVPGVEILHAADQPLWFEVLDDSSPILKLGQNRRGLILPVMSWTMERVQ